MMLLNMRSWQELEVDVLDDVILDPRNVRLVQEHETPQPLIINDLFKNAKALELVQAIALLGYLTHELPVVLQREDSLVVVEGNRRLAALKAIQNPYLVPTYASSINKHVSAISEDDREALRTIRVKVAPSQVEADQLIAALHTSNPRVPWGPDRQAAFFEAQVEAGRTLDELLALYPTIQVRKFVIRASALKLFKSVPYSNDSLRKALNDDRKVKVSILERLYEYDKFQSLAGIRVSNRTAVAEIVGTERRFFAVAEKVVGDIVGKRLNTRVLNRQDSPTYTEYMAELEAFVRTLEKQGGSGDPAGTGTSGSGGPGTGRGSSTAGGASGGRTSGPNHGSSSGGSTTGGDSESKDGNGSSSGSTGSRRISKKLDTTGLAAPAAMATSAIPNLLLEISQLNIEAFPNATFDLMRTLLEKTIKMYADVLNVNIRSEVSVRGHVMLDNCLDWLEQRVRADGATAIAGVIRKVKNGQLADYVATTDHLNAINHNPLISATPSEVRTAWNSTKPILEWMLKP
ncbi:hypothetical protein [Plantactinospora sp. BB1]|uniref:hypothetical protein n=1 Tax=Plantactinospora sp. BB1 TaxID=2071627 RepID=UPI00131EEB68|nr:hypothetical protein [Plantactinospora sp. BB1]